jgi:hypothetical protein
VNVGEFKVLAYVRNEAPGNLGGLPQQTLDLIFGNYADPAYAPQKGMGTSVTHAAILWRDGDERWLDFSDDEIQQRLQFGQFLTFAGLSARRFGNYSSYWNTSALTVVAQRFSKDSPAGVAFGTRRRDGHGNHMVSSAVGRPVFLRPSQTTARQVIDFDKPLLSALASVPAGTLRDRLLDAIGLFNQANTDASEVPESVELVLMRCAFESLLQCGFKAPQLRLAVNHHFASDFDLPAWHPGKLSEAVWRNRWTKDVGRPIDAWVQDFCHSRNDSAHGSAKKFATAPAIWSTHNHLLFSSWLFPFMVKGVLAEHGLYTLNDFDKDCRKHCEKFLSEDILAPVEPDGIYWNRIDGEIYSLELERELIRLSARMRTAMFPDSTT